MLKRIFAVVIILASLVIGAGPGLAQGGVSKVGSFAVSSPCVILNMWWPPLIAVGNYVCTTKDYRIIRVIAIGPGIKGEILDVDTTNFQLSRGWTRMMVFSKHVESGQELLPTEIVLTGK